MPVEREYGFWARVRAGAGIDDAAGAVGVSRSQGSRWFHDRGGVMPSKKAGQRDRCLDSGEREEIALLRAAGAGVREVARRVGRDPSTISRELRRVKHDRQRRDPDRVRYRASTAQADADRKARGCQVFCVRDRILVC